MTVHSTVAWTCDRCGATEEFVDKGDRQPMDWGSLVETCPPLADSDSKGDKLGHICRECRSDLREWMSEGGPRP